MLKLEMAFVSSTFKTELCQSLMFGNECKYTILCNSCPIVC